MNYMRQDCRKCGYVVGTTCDPTELDDEEKKTLTDAGYEVDKNCHGWPIARLPGHGFNNARFELHRVQCKPTIFDIPGARIWSGPGRKDFSCAPFASHDLGVIWKKKQVVYTGSVDWSAVIHEMGHVFACRVTPAKSEEYDFLGWEYALARHIGAPMGEWYQSMRTYSVEKGGLEFGELSPSKRFKLLQERLDVARKKKLVIGDFPLNIRK